MSDFDLVLLKVAPWLAVFGCVVVIIGVVLEGAELVVKLTKKTRIRKWVGEVFDKSRRRKLVSCAKYVEPRILPFEAVGFALLVFGLAIELLGSFTAERMQSKENSILEATNVQLWVRVEELRKANLELEASLAPRIFRDQLGAIMQLRKFSGTKILGHVFSFL